MTRAAQKILNALAEYGPTTVPVMELIVNLERDDCESFLQLLHYLEDQRYLMAVTAFHHEPVRPVTILERI
jgi:hypothetical protein